MAIPSELTKQNPWPGLRAFGENDRDFFFGRERETTELLDLVQRSPVVVLYGQSGLGKTSLLQAGLFPRLKSLDFLPFRVRFDHGDEAPPLARQITLAVAEELDRAQIIGPRPAEGETLWEYFHRVDIDFWGPRNRLLTPVIVLDQFEEIFTLGHRSEMSSARVADFQKELEGLLEHRPPDAVRERLEANPDEALHYDLKKQAIKFVITLREDFLPDLDPWRDRMPSLLPNRFRLERMTGKQALEVVQRGGNDLVDATVARDIVDFVSTSRRQRSTRALEQREVEPALLSVVCDGLNLSRIEHGKPRITPDLLSAEREEIMQDFYERTFQGVDPRVRDWVEDRLLTTTGYRDRAALDDARELNLPEADFDLLVNRRILHREERGGVIWLELTHDLLTDPASRSRAVREQRLQAKAAADREAAVRTKLRASRLIVGVFGVLLIFTAFALVRAIRSEKESRVAHQEAVDAGLDAQHSLQTAMKTAEARASDNAKWLRGELLHPTSGDFKIITDKIDDISTDEQQFKTSPVIKHKYAESLALAAEILFHQGRFQEGLAYPDKALDVISLLEKQEKEALDDSHRLLTAEAKYASGLGLLETGHIGDARQRFQEALKLSEEVRDPSSLHNAARLTVLSRLGLGDAGIKSFDVATAQENFKAGMDLANSTDSKDYPGEVDSWRAMALLGLGRSEYAIEDENALGYFDKANQIVDDQKKDHPGELLWQELHAQLAYSDGATALDMKRFADAFQLLKESFDTSSILSNANQRNLYWRFLLAQSWRGLGMHQQATNDTEAALKSFKTIEDIASAVRQEEPSWLLVSYLNGQCLFDQGHIAQIRSRDHSSLADQASAKQKADTDQKKTDEARQEAETAKKESDSAHHEMETSRSKFEESRQMFSNLESKVPESPEYARSLAVTLYYQGYGYLQGKNSDDDLKALALYRLAFQPFASIGTVANNNPRILDIKAFLYDGIGSLQVNQKKYPDAISAYQKETEIRAEIVTQGNEKSESLDNLSTAYLSLGGAFAKAGQTADATAQYDNALKAINDALADQPRDTTFLTDKARIQWTVADMWYHQGNKDKSIDALKAAIDTAKQAFTYEPYDYNLVDFVHSLNDTAKAYEKTPAGSTTQGGTTAKLSDDETKRLNELIKESDPDILLYPSGSSVSGNMIHVSVPQDWALLSLLPGPWHTLTDTERETELKGLSTKGQQFEKRDVVRIRALPLNFYNNATLFEAEVVMDNGDRGVVGYVRQGDQTIYLNGTSSVILSMNQKFSLNVDTVDKATAYLRFITGEIQLAYGRLNIIDRAEDLHWRPEATDEQRVNVARVTTPLIVHETPDGKWGAMGTVQLANELHYVVFQVSWNGDVVRSEAKPIAVQLPVIGETFLGKIRVLQTDDLQLRIFRAVLDKDPADPDGLSQLENLVTIHAQLSHWKEAADAEQIRIGYLERQTKHDETWTKTMQAAINRVGWYRILDHDFTGAIASTDEAKKLNVSDLPIELNHAHALLFLGKISEAEAIYFGNDGKKLEPPSEKTWDEDVFDDLNLLEKGGLTSPEFEHIRETLTEDQARRDLTDVDEQLKENPNDEKAIGARPDLLFTLKRYQEAIEAEKTEIAFYLRQTSHDKDWATSLGGAYVGLSWYRLFVRDFVGALASSEEALKLEPGDLPAETNHAHALLFLGRFEEAKDIYLKHRGEKVYKNSDTKWEATILKDFSDLQKAGITSPDVEKIRELLKK
jgi:tetratricopeptide (TPR) repeat protein